MYLMKTTNNTAAIDPNEQTREQRFWLIGNGFSLKLDITGTVWLYQFKTPKGYRCVGLYDGKFSVYHCNHRGTHVEFSADTFRAALAYSLRIKRAN